MVNTFVTSSDFEQSARWLDPSHLWKQILEATQILRLLEDLAMIAEHYHSKSIPPTYRGTDPSKLATNFLARCTWVKETCSTYMHLKTRFVYRLEEGQLKKTVVTVAESKTLTILYAGTNYTQEGDNVVVTISRYAYGDEGRKKVTTKDIYKRSSCLFYELGERIVTLGYGQHPIVQMWAGETDALKRYINAHLKEFVRRGGITEMQPFTVEQSTYPWWTACIPFHQTHRASLYRKHHTRKVPKSCEGWYAKIPEFSREAIGPWLECGYCWSANLNEVMIVKMISGKAVSPSDITVPITADSRPKKSQKVLRQSSRLHPLPYSGPYCLDQDGFVECQLIM